MAHDLPAELESIRISKHGDVGVWQRVSAGWRGTNVWRDGTVQQAEGATKNIVRQQLREQRS